MGWLSEWVANPVQPGGVGLYPLLSRRINVSDLIEVRDRFAKVCDEVRIFHAWDRRNVDEMTDEIADLEDASDRQLDGLVVVGLAKGGCPEFRGTLVAAR